MKMANDAGVESLLTLYVHIWRMCIYDGYVYCKWVVVLMCCFDDDVDDVDDSDDRTRRCNAPLLHVTCTRASSPSECRSLLYACGARHAYIHTTGLGLPLSIFFLAVHGMALSMYRANRSTSIDDGMMHHYLLITGLLTTMTFSRVSSAMPWRIA